MNNREEWIDLAKTLTMILVVVGHSYFFNINTPYGVIHNTDPTQTSIAREFSILLGRFIYTFHMPFFMALSGMTFALSYKPEKPFGKIALSKARRLLIPFFAVTLFLNVPLNSLAGYWDNSENPIYDIFVGQFLLMGNSHLWFVVSLFWITLLFTICLRIHFRPNILFWALSVAGFYIGAYIMEPQGWFFGFTGASKEFIFFAMGFYMYRYLNHKAIRWPYILLSWVAMLLSFFIFMNVAIPYKFYIGVAVSILLAMWGSINMILTSKATLKLLQSKRYNTGGGISLLINSLSNHSYEIYLYSFPLNFVFIPLFMLIFGDAVVTDNVICIGCFIVRIIGTVFLSYVIIWALAFAKRAYGSGRLMRKAGGQ